MKNYPNEIVQGVVDIKTAIENKSADTPVDIPDRDYPDELCEALGAVKDAIENSSGGGGGGDFALDIYDTPVMFVNSSGASISYSLIYYLESVQSIQPNNISLSKNQQYTTTSSLKCTLIDGALYLASATNKEINTYGTGTVEYVKITSTSYIYKITPNEDINKLSVVFTSDAHTYPES